MPLRSHPLRSAFALVLTCGLALAAAACDGDDGGGGDGTDSGDGDGDGDQERAVTIAFAAMVDGEAAACGQTYSGVGSAATDVELQDFRFYVSNVQLRDADGNLFPVTLDDDDWQHETVALLDFEDGTGLCADGGNAEMNAEVRGMVAEGDYTGIEFDLGVPFEYNHLDTTTAPSPLNVPSMFWNWQNGHKHLRIDFNNGAAMDAGWFVHLGSTGCTSAGATDAPTTPCAKPNLATVSLDAFDVDADTIVLDAGTLVGGADLTQNTAMTPPGCMSNPADVDECPSVFSSLGMSFESGACESNCEGQTVFSAM